MKDAIDSQQYNGYAPSIGESAKVMNPQLLTLARAHLQMQIGEMIAS